MTSFCPNRGVVLIVDDNPHNLAVLSDCLDTAGFEVRVASDGKNAIAKALYQTPDLILLDVMMPGINGFETCRQLKQDPRTQEIPIIFMTSLAETEDKVQAFSIGAVDYIIKPFQFEEVIARVELHLSLSSMTRKLKEENAARLEAEMTLRQMIEQQQQQLLEAEHQLMELEIQLFAQDTLIEGENYQRSWVKVFENTINKLRGEIEDRKTAEEELRRLKNALELQVAERTAELQKRNEELKRSEASLRKKTEILVTASKQKEDAMRQLEAANGALQAAQEQLRYDAYHDNLTKLPNRLQFKEALEEAIKMAQATPGYLYAVLFTDLDRFKVVNDSLGHLLGDELLKVAAQRLKEVIQPRGGIVARFGGDEFVILLPNLSHVQEAENIAICLHEVFTQPFHLNDYEVYTGLSIGITYSTNNYQQSADLLRDADIAMYQAKSNGRGRYEIFDPAMKASAMSRLQLENDLQRAIERQEFILYYQPIVSLSTGCLTGFESLVRWQHPSGRWVSPVQFIPIAEETGWIKAIGWWVMEEALRQTRQWYTLFPSQKLVVNVNLSPLQLNQKGFSDRVGELLQSYELPRSAVKLEITESSLLGSLDTEGQTLRQLRAAGTKLCIDDFGTGYSSLSRLHELPTDTLKIDRSFVNRMTQDSGAVALVKTIIHLAQGLHMDIVAEGIETCEQLFLLQSMGCDYGQGYLFQKPVDATTATHLLSTWNRSILQELRNNNKVLA